jgi:hypothetical protein
VHWRWSAPQFLRQTFIEWANESRKASVWVKAFYQAQKQAGKTHQEAIRSLALNGYGLSFDVGKMGLPMMSQSILRH